ncbi:MAG: hypothetical protein GC161_10085 [Planctomycetaceae bacterium]|nr:hypothetical protein [Planctomycetaceae bacterium]
MARRSPLLLLLFLPALALGAFYLFHGEPPSSQGVAGAALLGPEVSAVRPASAAETEAAPAAETPPARRASVAARIEGRVAYADGAIPGGGVLVYAGTPGAAWRWERAGRRVHAGLDADTLVRGFADAEGRFALEWSGDSAELAVAAMAPTAATEAPVRWSDADTAPLTLTLEPRAALFVDVRRGAGFDAATAPDFRDSELRLRLPSGSDERASGLSATRRNMSGWVDEHGLATFLAVPIERDFELHYKGPAAVETARTVAALASGEQRAMVLELPAGAHLIGRVVDELGAPVAGASLIAREPASDARSTASTDTEGRFEMPRVATSARSLDLSKDGHLAATHTLAADLVNGVRRNLGNLVLPHGARLAGHVRHPDGRPASRVVVTAYANRKALEDQAGVGSGHYGTVDAIADEEGHFVLRGLATDMTYDLVAKWKSDEAHFLARHEDTRRNQMDLILVLHPAPAIVGRVLAPDGTPVARAEVAGEPKTYSVHFVAGAHLPSTVRTDAEGRFRLEFESPGPVTVEANGRGFSPSVALSVMAPNDVPVELQLRRPTGLRGMVVDAAGKSVANAAVIQSEGNDNYGVITIGGSEPTLATSDFEGRFVVENQPPGPLALRAKHPEHAASADVVVEFKEDVQVSDLVLTLRRGAVVRGVLYRRGERAGADLHVTASAASEAAWEMTSTDAAGEFVFERLAPGRWQFSSFGDEGDTEEEDLVAVLANSHSQTLDLEDGVEYLLELGAPPADPIVVSGMVRQGGKAITEGLVEFLPHNPGSSASFTAGVDRTGRYEVVLAEPGGYAVMVSPMTESDFGSTVEFRCEVPRADSHEFNIELPSGAIRGQVRGPDGRPLQYSVVLLTRDDGAALGSLTGGGLGFVFTDEDGRYELTLLAAGSYRIEAGGSFPGGMQEMAPNTARSLRTGVRLEPNEVREGVDFDLLLPGQVQGRVVNSAGKAVAAAAVFARNAAGTAMEALGLAESDLTGSFRFYDLAPGEYTFEARRGGLVSAESGRVAVRAGEMAQVELPLAPGAFLTVCVEGADPAELAQGLVRVDMRDAQDRQVLGLFDPEELEESPVALAPNEHRVGPLNPGSYRVLATAPAGKRAEGTVELKAGQVQRVTLTLKD